MQSFLIILSKSKSVACLLSEAKRAPYYTPSISFNSNQFFCIVILQ